MAEETPILRADALDDDLQLDDEPRFATGGIIEHDPGPHGDSIPAFISRDCSQHVSWGREDAEG